MKYSEIIKYKKTSKNVTMLACYLFIAGASYIIAYSTKNTLYVILTILLGGIVFLPLEMRLEREIKEMEILLKLEKLLDRENTKPREKEQSH